MADKNDDIKHLFEHLGLDPTDYQEIKGPTKVVESARRWSLLGEVSEHPPRAAEIPEERRHVVAQLSAANRAQRIASIRNEDATHQPTSDRNRQPEGEEGQEELEAPNPPTGSGRLPPTVTWATDDQDSDEAAGVDGERMDPGVDDLRTEDANEASPTDDETEGPELARVDEESRESPQSQAPGPGDAEDEVFAPEQVGSEPAEHSAEWKDEDAEEAAAARAARLAAATRAVRERHASDTEQLVDDEPAADINLLGDFAHSIGAPPEPVTECSAQDAPARRKPQPKSAPSRASDKHAESGRSEASAAERRPDAPAQTAQSKTGAAIQGLLAATQKVKPTPTVSRSRSPVVSEPPARPSADSQKVAKAPPPPKPAHPPRTEVRQAPIVDEPVDERRQRGREDFESAIEAVAQAAKAEVRRRVEDERRRGGDADAVPGIPEQEAGTQSLLARKAENVRSRHPSEQGRSEQSEPVASAGQAPDPVRIKKTPESPVSATSADDEDAAPDHEPSILEAADVQAAPVEAPRAAASRPVGREMRAEAPPPRDRAHPSSGRAGPSPLRKLREAQPEPADVAGDARSAEPSARKGRLSDTFRRLQTPEKPAISASGKLRLNYGVRGGAQGVRTAQPETINEVFDRLRRNRRPGEPRK